MKFLLNFTIITTFLTLVILTFPKDVKAVSVSINDYPSTISANDPFILTVNVSGADDGTNYLRADFFKEGTSNYFGETFNANSWYSGSEGIQYFPVQIQNASGSASFQARIGNPNSNDYPGPGAYKLKIRRYTSSGNVASNDTFTPADLQITYQTPVPTSAPTASPTAIPSPTPSPTPTATPTKSPSPTPTRTTSRTPSPIAFATEEPGGPVQGEVLGLGTNASPSPLVVSDSVEKRKFPLAAVLFITGGLAFVGFALFMLFRSYQKEKIENTPNV